MRQKFFETLRAYDYLKKEKDKTDQKRSAKHEEKQFCANYWDFSKRLTSDTLYRPPNFPTFSKSVADDFFPSIPPSSWAESSIKLLHKKGDTDTPSNFRMIALASCTGKLFHQLIADRLHDFIVNNNIVNTKLQKAFLKGKNGCVEHNQVLHEIITVTEKLTRGLLT